MFAKEVATVTYNYDKIRNKLTNILWIAAIWKDKKKDLFSIAKIRIMKYAIYTKK